MYGFGSEWKKYIIKIQQKSEKKVKSYSVCVCVRECNELVNVLNEKSNKHATDTVEMKLYLMLSFFSSNS